MSEINQKLEILGLNENQRKAYLFIIEHKQVDLSVIAKQVDLTQAGVIKVLNDLIEKGFITKFKVGTKKYYLAKDLNELEEKYLRDIEDKKEKIKEVFHNLKEGYSKTSTIKIRRISSDVLVDTIHKLITNVKEIFEFVDLRGGIHKYKKINSFYRDKEVNVLYFEHDDLGIDWAKKVNARVSEKYAHILSFNDSVKFTTTNKETILIKNQEIANVVQLLISLIYNKK